MNANTQHHDAIDSTIDRALSALRDAQPRSGLEGRILASLEHRTIAPHPPRLQFSVNFALWTATAATVLAIASLIVLHHRVAAPMQLAHAPQSTSGLAAGFSPLNTGTKTNGALAPARSPVNAVILRRSRRTPVLENCSDHLRTGCTVHDDAVAVNEVSQTPTDAQLLADLHAPSHPAAPLPLTPQEKLFLRMLRYGNATQLAELNPIVRAQQDAEDTAAFHAFFPDPPPLTQPGDTE